MADTGLLVRFELLGRDVTNIIDWSIDSSYLVATDGFSFTVYDTDRSKLRGFEVQPVELIVNGASQALGRVDVTQIGDNGSAIGCDGRDYIADLGECNVDPTLKITNGMSVAEALFQAASPCGIDTILSDDDIALRDIRSGKKTRTKGTAKQSHKAKLSEYKPQPGESIYEFCNRIVARQGATIQPGPARNTLVITAPRYDQEPLYTIRRTDDVASASRNTIVTATARRDFSKFPTFSLFTGSKAVAGAKTTGVAKTVDIVEYAGNSPELERIIGASTAGGRRLPGKEDPPLGFGRLYRLLNFRDEEARDQDQIDNAAKRALSERLKDSLEYTVTLRGHSDPTTGALYSVDTMIRVEDAICDVSETLWIASRRFTYSPGQGAQTQLTCWRPEAFVL